MVPKKEMKGEPQPPNFFVFYDSRCGFAWRFTVVPSIDRNAVGSSPALFASLVIRDKKVVGRLGGW